MFGAGAHVHRRSRGALPTPTIEQTNPRRTDTRVGALSYFAHLCQNVSKYRRAHEPYHGHVVYAYTTKQTVKMSRRTGTPLHSPRRYVHAAENVRMRIWTYAHTPASAVLREYCTVGAGFERFNSSMRLTQVSISWRSRNPFSALPRALHPQNPSRGTASAHKKVTMAMFLTKAQALRAFDSRLKIVCKYCVRGLRTCTLYNARCKGSPQKACLKGSSYGKASPL